MELFKLDPGLAVWTWITFGLLFLILWKFVLPPILGNIRTREAAIAKAVDNALLVETKLKEIEQEHAEMIKTASAEADSILRKARAESDKIRQRLLEKAEAEAKAIIQEGQAKIAQEKEEMIQSLRMEIADFVCDSSEKLIGRSFLTREERTWAKEMVEAL